MEYSIDLVFESTWLTALSCIFSKFVVIPTYLIVTLLSGLTLSISTSWLKSVFILRTRAKKRLAFFASPGVGVEMSPHSFSLPSEIINPAFLEAVHLYCISCYLSCVCHGS